MRERATSDVTHTRRRHYIQGGRKFMYILQMQPDRLTTNGY